MSREFATYRDTLACLEVKASECYPEALIFNKKQVARILGVNYRTVVKLFDSCFTDGYTSLHKIARGMAQTSSRTTYKLPI